MKQNSKGLNITIRTMLISDYPDVLDIWQGSTGLRLGQCHSQNLIESFLIRNPDLSQVALVNNKIVGAALCGYDGITGFIHHLAVKSSYKQSGIGTSLVKTCLDKLRKIKIEKCQIIVANDNTIGRIFWENIGWESAVDRLLMQWSNP
jgi:ribosomal protein S18 acetylase RimI-like enzyme